MKIPRTYRQFFNYLNHKEDPKTLSENDVFNKNVDTVIITGGRGSGKSWPVAMFLNIVSAKFKGINILFSRYTMTSAGSSIIPEFQEKIDINGFSSVMRPVTRDGKKVIESDNRSEILFRGIKTSSGNQTAALKSLKNIAIWVLDEAEELIYETEYDKIDLSIRSNDYKNLTILILNPTHKRHWIYQRFFKETGVKAGFNGISGNVMYIHTTFLDNILNLPEKIIRSYKRLFKRDRKKFNHVVMGGWLDKKEGLVYPDWQLVDERPNNIRCLGFGLDYGFANDPTAFVAVFEVMGKTDTIYLETIFQETGLFNADIAQRIKSSKDWQRNRSKFIVGDSAAPEKNQELSTKYKLNVIPSKKGANSVKTGIDRMNDFTVMILRGNEIANEAAEYAYSPDMDIEDKYENNPDKGNDHSLDAARYFVTCPDASKLSR